jgi:hypothetical protein
MYTPGPFAPCKNIICYDGVSPNTKPKAKLSLGLHTNSDYKTTAKKPDIPT